MKEIMKRRRGLEQEPNKEEYLPVGGLKLMLRMGVAYLVVLLVCLAYAYFLMESPEDLSEFEATRFSLGVGLWMGLIAGAIITSLMFIHFLVLSYFGYKQYKSDLLAYFIKRKDPPQ